MPSADVRREVALGGEGYPSRLAELTDPPARLYIRGAVEALAGPCLSIVGARRATPYGIAVAEMAGRVAAESGVTVVSGGARGVDQAAGTAALDAGGRHVVVLGCGADVTYPKSSAGLISRAIGNGGAAVSLDPWGTPPRKWAFPRRNRVIAALSEALVITEAGLPSGTFSTAETALELGRELLAVPGSILSPASRGSNRLISEGATCIADEEALEVAVSRIYGVLRLCRSEAPAPSLPPTEARVLEALVATPMRAEAIARMLGTGPTECLLLLSDMSVAGLVERLRDGCFAPTKSALHARTGLGHNMGSR